MQEGIAKLYKRNCPLCGCELLYDYPSKLKRAEDAGSVCRPCNMKRWNGSGKYSTAKEGNGWWKGYKGVGYKWFSKYFERGRGKQKQKEGSITIQDAYDKLEAQGFRCALSGIPLEWSEESGMSIDRIDSSAGYHLDNIQIVHKDVNLMKNHFSQEYFLDVCKRIVKYKII